jgi:hypothetical protein
MKDFEGLELEIPGGEGEATLGGLMRGFVILWRKENIMFPNWAPRIPTPPRPSTPPSPRTPPRDPSVSPSRSPVRQPTPPGDPSVSPSRSPACQPTPPAKSACKSGRRPLLVRSLDYQLGTPRRRYDEHKNKFYLSKKPRFN